MMADLLAVPFLACLVLTGIHAYLGLHVLARGVIFVDLALAQVAALGMTAGLLAGHAPQSDAAYGWALAFTGGGAALFALTRERRGVVPQEAIIGIVYAVTAALTVLVLDRVPQGSEYIKQLLVGSILAVTADEVLRVAALYAVVGVFHWLARGPMLALSSGGAPPRAALWDFAFYFTFGLVVTSSVRVAGVLLVFSYLIVPAVIGAWLARGLGRRLLIGWAVGVLVSALGLALSYLADLPTGATVVATFGAVLAIVGLSRGMLALAHRVRREGARALAGLGVAIGSMVALAGVGLALFPRADHVWLDGLEGFVPVVQTAFLTPYERGVVNGSRAAIARGRTELRRLRALDADAQWGLRALSPEEQERLRQFLAGRDELVAGDLLVLRTLRDKARERQRLPLGIPLALGGATLALLAFRWGRSNAGMPGGRSTR
ncbi:MAG TPA: metal ABC transporter permease [Methylomirabilota bacterium]|nr:metal ABC transporter permease [Methylomirabilota bacterium]